MAAGTVSLQPTPNDPGFYDWLASQPADVQDATLTQYYGPDWEKSDTLRKRLGKAERDRFERGESVPGMSPSGAGAHATTPGQQAGINLGRNVTEAEAIRDQYAALGPEAYTAVAEREQAPASLLDRLEYADENIPDFEAAQQAEAINQARTDTTGIDTQKRVLGEYANLYAQGGLNAIDRARMEQARRERQAQGLAQEGAIMQQAEQMGRAGSAASMLARQQAQQGVTSARSMDDLQTMALGLQRRDRLLGSQADLGGSIQSAQDVIDQFNTQGERDRVQQNLQREQEARRMGYVERGQRGRENAAGQREGATTEFKEDAARGARNADRTTQVSMYNVGPTQGARGQVYDQGSAVDRIIGTRQDVAGRQERKQTNKEAADAAQEEAAIKLATFGAEKAVDAGSKAWKGGR